MEMITIPKSRYKEMTKSYFKMEALYALGIKQTPIYLLALHEVDRMYKEEIARRKDLEK